MKFLNPSPHLKFQNPLPHQYENFEPLSTSEISEPQSTSEISEHLSTSEPCPHQSDISEPFSTKETKPILNINRVQSLSDIPQSLTFRSFRTLERFTLRIEPAILNKYTYTEFKLKLKV